MARALNANGTSVVIDRWRRSLVIDHEHLIAISTAKHGSTPVNKEPFWFSEFTGLPGWRARLCCS
jgi:regulator of sigma D